MLADQCTKAFDQIPTLLTDIRSIDTPEGVVDIEHGLERARDSEIGTTLAEVFKQYVDSCSRKDIEIIQSALTAATSYLNTCSQVAKKAQKKRRWDKDLEKKLEENWFLFSMQLIKISKLLPLQQTDLQSLQSLCTDASVSLISSAFESHLS